ncbi:MAG: glycosyltransferase family 2 protein [Muribaculaceae bacterium]|nr:glycosyltransferase family 2 protein [Muribaculaceae bacterium]
MSFTASIVIHNTPRIDIERAVESLMRSKVEKIYILDNGSLPASREIFSNNPLIDYRVIPNKGYGAGHNHALREVMAQNPEGYHIVMNPDIYWEGDAVKPLIEYMEKKWNVGMSQPRIVYPDGVLQYTCRKLPTPYDLFAKRFLPRFLNKKRMDKYLLVDHDHHQPLDVAYLQGSFMLIRVKALKRCGIFDERFFMYPEDIDLTRRIHDCWDTRYLPLSEVVHGHNAESRRNLRMLLIHLFNMIKYFNKWGWVFDQTRSLYNELVEREKITPPDGVREEGRG